MKSRFLLFVLMSTVVLIHSCQKEYSFESGAGPSEGTLQDDGSGDCLPKLVAGAYVVGTILDGNTNYIEVEVDVTVAGSYTIYTDTVNGISFKATGFFTTTGLNTVKLKGTGTPTAAGIHNFIVTYGTSGCSIAVTTAGSLAVFTFDGAPGNCTGATPAGVYQQGVALTSVNSVNITVIATVAGAYNISAGPVNGMTFTGSGTLPSAGTHTIVLTGTGTPGTAGATTIPLVAGTSRCPFLVTVQPPAAAAVFTLDCASAVPNGTYTQNTPLTAANTITVTANVTTVGAYTITGTLNGMTFTGTGTFATATAQQVTLTGSGTPTTAGSNAISLTGGTTPCNATVTVGAVAGGATFTIDCATAFPNGTYTQNTPLTVANTVTIGVNVTVAGTYAITGSLNGMTFSGSGTVAVGPQNVTLNATGTPTVAGNNLIPLTGGTGTCNLTINVVATAVSDYYPRTTNSNWSYEVDDVSDDSLFRKVIAPTKVAFGNTFNIYMATADISQGFDSSGYIRRSGGDYYEFLDIGSYIGLDESLWAEYIFLKDNVAANTSWTTASYTGNLSGTPITVRLRYTVSQKDVSVSLTTSTGTVSYPNTIIIEERVEVQNGATWLDLTPQIGLFKNYFSRNVGLIKQEFYEPADLVNPAFEMELRRHLVL